MTWKAGLNRNLPVVAKFKWDLEIATKNIFTHCLHYQEAFLIYDSDDKSKCLFPFADVVNGKLVASVAGLKYAFSELKKSNIKLDKEDMDILRNSYSKYFNETYRFDSDLPVVSFAADSEKKKISIDMLRTGKFKRKSWFGDFIITIDEEMIDYMIKNFNDKVIARGIPLDTNHDRGKAHAWLDSVRKYTKEVKGKMQTFLSGDWAVNSEGEKLIKDAIYKFFSIEFDPNYEQYEVFNTTKGPDGTEIPVGETVCYGPTITGGALTNRPFIPDMAPVPMAFSESDNYSNLSNLIEFDESGSGSSSEHVLPLPQSEIQKPVIKETKISFNWANFLTHDKEKTGMKTLISFMENQLSKIEDKNSTEFKELSAALEKARQEVTASENELKKKDDSLREASETNQKLFSTVNDLSGKVVSLENRTQASEAELSVQRERARVDGVKVFCSQFKNLTKPTHDKIQEILLADKKCESVVMLGEGANQKTLNLKDVIFEIVNSLPPSARVPLGEGTFSGPGKGGDFKDFHDNETDVEKFEKEHGDEVKRGVAKVKNQYAHRKTRSSNTPAADKN